MGAVRGPYGRGSLEWITLSTGQVVGRLTVDMPRGTDGKRCRRMFTLRGSKREIERERTRILSELFAGELIKASPETLAQYLEYWLENAVRHRLEERTYESHRQYCEYYIAPHLGGLRLSEITSSNIQSFYTMLLTSGRQRRLPNLPPGLSTTTVHNIHRTLHHAMEWAVRWKMISANPTDRVALPKVKRRKPAILTREQVAQLLSNTSDTKMKLLIMIGVSTGLRRGEILGLRWSDVDLESGILRIQHSLVDTGRRLIEKEPKTQEGVRPLAMPSVLIELLREHRDQQNSIKQLLGSGYQDNDLVLCWEDGRPIHPSRFYRPLRNLLRKLGLPEGASIHDLRHSHATHLLADRIHPKTVSERLGHADVETTLNLYSHLLPHIQQEAADATDIGLRDALAKAAECP